MFMPRAAPARVDPPPGWTIEEVRIATRDRTTLVERDAAQGRDRSTAVRRYHPGFVGIQRQHSLGESGLRQVVGCAERLLDLRRDFLAVCRAHGLSGIAAEHCYKGQ